MSAGDVFLMVVRWLHHVAAVVWVGGSIFYLLVLRPAARKEPGAGTLQRRVGLEFQAVVDTAIFVLVITGGVLAFDKLTSKYVGAAYFSVLGIKIALSAWMFILAHSRLRGRHALLQRAEGRAIGGDAQAPGSLQRFLAAMAWANLIAILGIIVFLLSDLLRALYEGALKDAL
ncbi:MAG: hypothetical protein EXR48_05225 [Dehalococcoidia bacterium]|nr:hypothetical protein [Dehalococcoidia bacterium]